MAKECQIGSVVLSRAGRDKDNSFIIIDILDENYVYICDGNIHTLDKPKKEKKLSIWYLPILFVKI